MKRLWPFVAALLAALGVMIAAAFAASTGTVSACATTPAQTIADNGSPIATVPAETACTTVTYTTPTVPVTDTGTTTTTTTPPSTPVSVAALKFGDEFNGAAGTLPSSTLWGAKSSSSSGSLANWNGWNQISENGSGDVVITAAKQSTGRWNTGWLSGKVAYGGQRYVEARAKVPCGYGTWSAPAWEWDAPYGAGGLEVDESEQLGRSPTANNVHIHNWTVSPQKAAGGPVATSSTLCNGFHTYGAAIYSDHIDFYLDGVKDDTLQASAIGLSSLTASSLQEVANISLNMGGWGGTPTISGPVSMLVDYVHVYALP